MGIKQEIDAVILGLQAIINVILVIDPNAKENVVLIEVNKVINLLKSLGL